MSGLETGSGPRQIDPRVGEILVTTEGIDHGRQHLWEAFPGRSGETAVYLFYYGPAKDRVPGALSALYARFFERLEVYKSGPAKLVRPTFGFIPGWSRLSPAPASGSRRVILVGDAAARHSPLTFCGFGATLRSLVPAGRAIARAVESRGVTARDSFVVDDASIHHGTGALARMLASPSLDPGREGSLNELLDAAFSTLSEMGEESFAALLKDEMTLPSFITFLRITAKKKPGVYREVFEKLGLRTMLGWGGNLVRASL
jgi:lycopene cyclase CruA